MITSTKNQRIVELRKLSQRKHRRRQNRFMVEGLQLIAIALETLSKAVAIESPPRIVPLDLFYSEELFTGDTAPRLLEGLVTAGATAHPVAPHVLDSLSERDTCQGLIATFALREIEHTLSTLLSLLSSPSEGSPLPEGEGLGVRERTSTLILILDRLQDPGNLGTLIRTADAVGATGLILLEPSVDPFDPKTVRGTMGSIFSIPFVRTDDVAGVATGLTERGVRLVGADGQQGQPPWLDRRLSGSVGLVLGNEARGLSPDIRAYVDDYVRLPLHGQAESLNVAIAGGVLMYEWLRQNG
ncbi:MAG: RNA methyltransferase [Anaerolineae bacterium]|nr:RNA methyltransferase [Anaerolineae bacterium]